MCAGQPDQHPAAQRPRKSIGVIVGHRRDRKAASIVDVAVEIGVGRTVRLRLRPADAQSRESGYADTACGRAGPITRSRIDIHVAGAAVDRRSRSNVASGSGVCTGQGAGAAARAQARARGAGRIGQRTVGRDRVAAQVEVVKCADRDAIAGIDGCIVSDIAGHRWIDPCRRHVDAECHAGRNVRAGGPCRGIAGTLADHGYVASGVDGPAIRDVRVDGRRRIGVRDRAAGGEGDRSRGRQSRRVRKIRRSSTHVHVATGADVARQFRTCDAGGLSVGIADAYSDPAAGDTGSRRVRAIAGQRTDRDIAPRGDLAGTCREGLRGGVVERARVRARAGDNTARTGESSCRCTGAATLVLLGPDFDIAPGVDTTAKAEVGKDIRRDHRPRDADTDRERAQIHAEQRGGYACIRGGLYRHVAVSRNARECADGGFHVRIDRGLRVIDLPRHQSRLHAVAVRGDAQR